MIKQLIKRMLEVEVLRYLIKAGASISLVFTNLLSYFAKKIISLNYRIEFIRDWILSGKTPPNFYKHLNNLHEWQFNPSHNMFTTAPALARLHLKKEGKVLDLCCGDGSTSYLFFSDISERVDAVDINRSALTYARKQFKKTNVNFIESDVADYLSECPTFYDLYYMGSAFDYFSREERSKIFQLIRNKMTFSSILVIKTPLWEKEIYSRTTQLNVGAKVDYADNESEFCDELKAYFTNINIFVAEYSARTEAIAICKR